MAYIYITATQQNDSNNNICRDAPITSAGSDSAPINA